MVEKGPDEYEHWALVGEQSRRGEEETTYIMTVFCKPGRLSAVHLQ